MSSEEVTTKLTPNVPPGHGLPLSTPYAVSLSLPAWKDHCNYWLGGEKVFASCVNTYPRLFPHPSVRELASKVLQGYGSDIEKCLPFPTHRIAEECYQYMQARDVDVRVLSFVICPDAPQGTSRIRKVEQQQRPDEAVDMKNTLHVVVFPEDKSSCAHTFWNTAGLGITVRQADNYLSMIDGHVPESQDSAGQSAKKTIRQRIANGVQEHKDCAKVTEDDVFLFQSGMAAIWTAHQLALQVRPVGKSVCFGAFPSTQTVLKHWGPGCHFYGYGSEEEIDALEALLEEEFQRDASRPPILALFTEFTANPLAWSPNLPRLRALADKYEFLIVVDDTIGGLANVDVMPYSDIVVTSLTKMFSGYADALGGSIILNPNCRHYVGLKDTLKATFEDTFYSADAVVLECNSRDYYERSQIVDANAEAICDLLHARSVAGGVADAAVKTVYYPKYITRENYEICRIKASRAAAAHGANELAKQAEPGFGCLVSLTFTSPKASYAFFEALDSFKGLSFGLNITVACPFAVSSATLGWGAPYGIEDDMLRISIGLEDKEALLASFRAAVEAAEAALKAA